MTPAPKGAGTIQCYIKRKKSGFSKMFPEYRVYMKLPEEVSVCICSLAFRMRVTSIYAQKFQLHTNELNFIIKH